MNVLVLLDNKTTELAKVFSPEYNLANIDYYKIGKLLFMPSTLVATITNYLNKDEGSLNPQQDPVAMELINS